MPWRIKNVIQEIVALTGVVPHASLCWVPREANGATTSLAKWSLKNRFGSSFEFCNCPHYVSDILIWHLVLDNVLGFLKMFKDSHV